MPSFNLGAFVDFTLGYLVDHPIAYGVLIGAAVIVCVKLVDLAVTADVSRRRKLEANERRLAAVKQAARELQAQRHFRAVETIAEQWRAQERGR